MAVRGTRIHSLCAAVRQGSLAGSREATGSTAYRFSATPTPRFSFAGEALTSLAVSALGLVLVSGVWLTGGAQADQVGMAPGHGYDLTRAVPQPRDALIIDAGSRPTGAGAVGGEEAWQGSLSVSPFEQGNPGRTPVRAGLDREFATEYARQRNGALDQVGARLASVNDNAAMESRRSALKDDAEAQRREEARLQEEKRKAEEALRRAQEEAARRAQEAAEQAAAAAAAAAQAQIEAATRAQNEAAAQAAAAQAQAAAEAAAAQAATLDPTLIDPSQLDPNQLAAAQEQAQYSGEGQYSGEAQYSGQSQYSRQYWSAAQGGSSGQATFVTPGQTMSTQAVSGQATTPLPPGRYSLGPRWGAVGSWARYHTGQDLSAPIGTPVRAVAAGVVMTPNAGGWAGTHVIINHGSGVGSTLYAHMQAATVRPGQLVSPGQVIGYVGMTGRTFGPHLHFEYYPPGRSTTTPYNTTDPYTFMLRLGIRL